MPKELELDSPAYPTDLQLREGNQLTIIWNDGKALAYSARELRDRCPCATCREKKQQPAPLLQVLSAVEIQPLTIRGMRPVGNYAYNIAFSDGHDTGIFTLALLQELGKPSPE